MLSGNGSIVKASSRDFLQTRIVCRAMEKLLTEDFSVADTGEKGLVQVASVLPRSYPGHILLTEDEGRVLGEDDCPCGRKGRYFEILGRVKQAEIRGCSDTYEQK